MENRIWITQALAEREQILLQIDQKIGSAAFVAAIKKYEKELPERNLTREAFAKEMQDLWEQVQTLMRRYQKLEEAILASNAVTVIETSFGNYTVAAALALRDRLRGEEGHTLFQFEETLLYALENAWTAAKDIADQNNRMLQEYADEMRLHMLAVSEKGREEEALSLVEKYIEEHTTELLDPLHALQLLKKIRDDKEKLLSELETGIRISNATTCIVLRE